MEDKIKHQHSRKRKRSSSREKHGSKHRNSGDSKVNSRHRDSYEIPCHKDVHRTHKHHYNSTDRHDLRGSYEDSSRERVDRRNYDSRSSSRERRKYRNDVEESSRRSKSKSPSAGKEKDKLKSKFELKSEKLKVNSNVPSTSIQPTFVTTPVVTTRLVEEIEKRKLIFNKKPPESSTSSMQSVQSLWEETKFSDDNDGRIQAKFKRLMGIKAEAPCNSETSKDPKTGKRHDEYLADLEKQYEVARVATHTQRGLGLGFASRIDRFPL